MQINKRHPKLSHHERLVCGVRTRNRKKGTNGIGKNVRKSAKSIKKNDIWLFYAQNLAFCRWYSLKTWGVFHLSWVNGNRWNTQSYDKLLKSSNNLRLIFKISEKSDDSLRLSPTFSDILKNLKIRGLLMAYLITWENIYGSSTTIELNNSLNIFIPAFKTLRHQL